MYSGGGKALIKDRCVIIKMRGLIFVVKVCFSKSFERNPALCPKTREPGAAGLYGIVPQLGKRKTSASGKIVFISWVRLFISNSPGTTIR